MKYHSFKECPNKEKKPACCNFRLRKKPDGHAANDAGWRIVPGLVTSGHSHPAMDVPFSGDAPVAGGSGGRLNGLDWDLFATTLVEEIKPVKTAQNSETAAVMLTKAITRSADLSIPKARPRKKSVPWWLEELRCLSVAVARVQKELQRSRRAGRTWMWGELKGRARLTRNALNEAIRRAKKASQYHFVEKWSSDP